MRPGLNGFLYKIFELLSRDSYPVSIRIKRRSPWPVWAPEDVIFRVSTTALSHLIFTTRWGSESLLSTSSNDFATVDLNPTQPSSYFGRFGWLGMAATVLMLCVAMPFIVALVLLTKLTSRGPGIYRQTRVGFKGEVFTVYKIRTMANDAESKSGPVWTAGISDPRVTALGKFMRASHLDELPQLFNVLRGEMSIIGPRPERPEFTQFLAQEIPGYVGRLSVKPGITGLAQIILPADSDLESVQKKLDLDLEYVRGGTLVLDFKIAVCTAIKMIGMRSSDAANWLGVMKHTSLKNGFDANQMVIAQSPSEASQKDTGVSHPSVRKSVSLNELVEGVSAKEQSESSGQVDADKSERAMGDSVLGDVLDDDLVARQLAESSGLGSIDDPDSGSMGSLPT